MGKSIRRQRQSKQTVQLVLDHKYCPVECTPLGQNNRKKDGKQTEKRKLILISLLGMAGSFADDSYGYQIVVW